MKWDKFYARSSLALARPSAKRTLSIMLLFPDPFGPETVVNPLSKGISDLLANDLKLSISSCFMYINSYQVLFLLNNNFFGMSKD